MNWLRYPYELPPIGKPIIVYGVGEFTVAAFNGKGFTFPKVDGYICMPCFGHNPSHFCQDVPAGKMMEMWEKVKDQLTGEEEPDQWSFTKYPHLKNKAKEN